MGHLVTLVDTPVNGACRIGGTTAPTGVSTSRSTPVDPILLYTAGTLGARIDTLRVNHIGAIGTACAANIIRLWIERGDGVYRLWREIVVSATTPTASTAGFNTEITGINLVLQAGAKIYASIHAAAANDLFEVLTLFGGNF